jgi:hypothetical protein
VERKLGLDPRYEYFRYERQARFDSAAALRWFVAEGISVLDHDVALMNAYSEFDAVVWCAGTLLGHAALPFRRTTQRVNYGSELNQQPISGRFDDATPVFGDLRLD